MCEVWRIVNRQRTFNKEMSTEKRVEALLMEEFQHHIECSLPMRYPDIYYQNPFTEE